MTAHGGNEAWSVNGKRRGDAATPRRPGRKRHFSPVPWELMDDPRCDAYTIAVYAALKRYANFGSELGAEVGDAKAAAKAGCGERTFRNRRRRLREMGWIDWRQVTGETNVYVIFNSPKENLATTPAPRAGVTPEPRHHVPGTPAPRAGPPRHHVPTTKSHLPRASTERTSLAIANAIGAGGAERVAHARRNGRAGRDHAATARGHLHRQASRLMGSVRDVLYAPDGKPPPSWEAARDMTILVEMLEHGIPPDQIEAGIRGVGLLRARRSLAWLGPGDKATMRALYHAKSGVVPVFYLAEEAYHEAASRKGRKRKRSGGLCAVALAGG